LACLVLYAIKRWINHCRNHHKDGQDLIGKIAYWGKAVPVDLESDKVDLEEKSQVTQAQLDPDGLATSGITDMDDIDAENSMQTRISAMVKEKVDEEIEHIKKLKDDVKVVMKDKDKTIKFAQFLEMAAKSKSEQKNNSLNNPNSRNTDNKNYRTNLDTATNTDDQVGTPGGTPVQANSRNYASGNISFSADQHITARVIPGETLSRGTMDETPNDEPDPFGGAGTALKDLLQRDSGDEY
jgi:hypothetical protein